MANGQVKDIEMIKRLMHGIADHALKLDVSTKGVAENVATLVRQLDHGHGGFKNWLKEVIKLPAPLQAVSKAIVSQRRELLETLDNVGAAADLARAKFKEAQAAQDKLPQRWVHKRAAEQKFIDAAQAELKVKEKAFKLAEAELTLHDKTNALFGKRFAIEYMVISGFEHMVQESFLLSKSVADTNADYERRRLLFQDVLAVQMRTGASTERAVGATKALRNAGLLLHGDFKGTLEAVLQMEQGLGVSQDNAAQLARVFQINLATPVRSVANDITNISNSTSLAADEATRFATEIGKALRLLGPGGALQAREVTGYVTAMAARMKDVGGDANEIVRLFSEMTKGTTQGFMLRGLAGVGSPGAVGTQAGAQQAMEGVGRVIDRIVRAAPSTRMYAAQLEAAAQYLNISTESVRLYRDMLAEAKKPLDAQTTLQRHWEQQLAASGEAFHNALNGLEALLRRGFSPVLHILTPLLNGLASMARWLSTAKYAVTVVTTAVIGGTILTVAALYQFAKAAAIVGIATLQAARAERALALERGLTGAASKGGLIGTLLRPMMGFLGSLSRFLPVLPAMIGPGMAAALIVAAPFIGYAIGKGINFLWDKMIEKLYPKKDLTKTAYFGGVSSANAINRADLDSMVRHAIAVGGIKAGIETVKENIWRLKGIDTSGPGWRAGRVRQQLDDYVSKTLPNLAAQVRERIALSTVTAEREATARRDKEMIELARENIKTMRDEVPDLGKKLIQDRREAQLKEEAEARKKELLDKTSAPLSTDPWAPKKDSRYDRFQGFMR